MDYKILFVDDDELLLSSISRNLSEIFPIVTMDSGQHALDFLKKEYCPIVISDMRMPGMDGVEFLSAVRKMNPDSVRVMLTGNADLGTAVSAVNEGQIFRFLLKPCPIDVMQVTLESCVRQYELVTAEKELLEKTLLGSIKAMTDLLAIVNPLAYAHTARVSRLVKIMVKRLQPVDGWSTEIAALFSPIVFFMVSDTSMGRLRRGDFLSIEEKKAITGAMKTGCDTINRIPRMKDILKIVSYQLKNYDGSGYPEDQLRETEIPFGARILRVAMDFEYQSSKGLSPRVVMETMKTLEAKGAYDPSIIDLLDSLIVMQSEMKKTTSITGFNDLKSNMIFEEDLKFLDGTLLAQKGQTFSIFLKSIIENGEMMDKIKWPVSVSVAED
jgi:response regulator RpfG family c-di-GMP phosphodiesterase